MAYAETWTLSNSTDTFDYVCSAADNGIMYASTNYNNPIDEKGVIAKSTDYGKTWTEVQDDVGQFTTIACSSNGQYAYCSAFIDSLSEQRLYRSVDAGATWTVTSHVVSSSAPIKCSANGQIVYELSNGVISKSTDYGATFSNIYTDPDNGLANLDCSADGSVIVCPNNTTVAPVLLGGVISTNSGSSFTTLADLGIGDIFMTCNVSGDGNIILITKYGTVIKKSTNQGVSWSDITVSSAIGSIATSSDCSKIVLGMQNGDTESSINSGASWTTYTDPAGDYYVGTIAQTANGSNIILANDNGIYYSTTFVVDAVTPATGSIAGGTPVTVEGLGFDPAATAAIGGNDLTSLTVVDSTTITGITPAGTAGAKDVTVTNP